MTSESDTFFSELDAWADEARALRKLVLDAGLTETWKWRQPCYVHGDKNVLMVAVLKNYVALAFFQGVLLDDPEGVLVSPGKNSQSVKQLRVTSVEEIKASEKAIASFIADAIAHAEAGTEVSFPAKDKLELPDELVERFAEVDGLEDSFMALTPGRQRGLVLHIGGAKQSATRSSRVDKNIERILAGKGIHDCYCGKSARMPRCDGSHSR